MLALRNQPNKFSPFFPKVFFFNFKDMISWGIINNVFLASLMWNNFGLRWNKSIFVNGSETLM